MNVTPKILFINVDFRYNNSAGITISKLIDHFPKENLGLLSYYANRSDIDIFAHKFQISKNESNKEIQFSRKNKTDIKESRIRYIWLSIVKRIIRNTLGTKYRKRKYYISNQLKSWLLNFNPDYIYLNPYEIETIEFALKISELLNCRIIIHVMDDKVSINYPGILGKFYNRKLKNRFEEIVKRSDIRLSISEKMASVYYKRYKKKFITFHNPINVDEWEPFTKKDVSLKSEVKIIYSGSSDSTFNPIIEFCKVIAHINQNHCHIKFVLYSKFNSYKAKKKLEGYPFVEINDYVSQKELPRVLTDADFLFLPLSFEKRLSYTSLSMPTKTAEYMISGTPIILYSPCNTALVDYAREKNWAYSITTNQFNDAVQLFKELLGNKKLRKNISENAVTVAKKNHDVLKNKDKFDQILL
jgi:hypothetical protein